MSELDVLVEIRGWLSQVPEGVDPDLWFKSLQGTLRRAETEIAYLRSIVGAVTPGQSVADIKEHLRSLPRGVSTTSTAYFKDAGPQ